MPKRKDKSKSKSKYRIKSKNNKNKNSINIKIIGGQGGGGGGAGSSSSHTPYHPSHHQDIDYDRIRNIFYQPNPRSPLTQESVNPPPIHQAVDITPNVSTNQNMQITPKELRTVKTKAFDYTPTSKVGKMISQTPPVTSEMYFNNNNDIWLKSPKINLNNEDDFDDENINTELMEVSKDDKVLKNLYDKYKDDTTVKTKIKKVEKSDVDKANYKEYIELKAQCKAAGNSKDYQDNQKDKTAMLKWLKKNTKSG